MRGPTGHGNAGSECSRCHGPSNPQSAFGSGTSPNGSRASGNGAATPATANKGATRAPAEASSGDGPSGSNGNGRPDREPDRVSPRTEEPAMATTGQALRYVDDPNDDLDVPDFLK